LTAPKVSGLDDGNYPVQSKISAQNRRDVLGYGGDPFKLPDGLGGSLNEPRCF